LCADRVVRLMYFLRINESAGPHLHESEASQIPAVLYKIRRRMDSIYWLSLWMYPPPREDRDRRHGPHGGSRNSPWPVAAVSMDAGQGASAAVWSEEGDTAEGDRPRWAGRTTAGGRRRRWMGAAAGGGGGGAVRGIPPLGRLEIVHK